MNRIDLSNTAHVIFFIVLLPILSVSLVLVLSTLLAPFENQWFFPFIDGFGFIGAYVALFSLFEKKFWQYPFFRSFGIVTIPVIEGRWIGYIESSHDNRISQIPTVLEVDQTFSTIKTCLYTDLSFSSSLMADFVQASTGLTELHYEYHNEPNEKAPKTMHGHDGVVRLVYDSQTKLLTGSYYNTSQHDRGNVGSLYFEFESKDTCACFKKP